MEAAADLSRDSRAEFLRAPFTVNLISSEEEDASDENERADKQQQRQQRKGAEFEDDTCVLVDGGDGDVADYQERDNGGTDTGDVHAAVDSAAAQYSRNSERSGTHDIINRDSSTSSCKGRSDHELDADASLAPNFAHGASSERMAQRSEDVVGWSPFVGVDDEVLDFTGTFAPPLSFESPGNGPEKNPRDVAVANEGMDVTGRVSEAQESVEGEGSDDGSCIGSDEEQLAIEAALAGPASSAVENYTGSMIETRAVISAANPWESHQTTRGKRRRSAHSKEGDNRAIASRLGRSQERSTVFSPATGTRSSLSQPKAGASGPAVSVAAVGSITTKPPKKRMPGGVINSGKTSHPSGLGKLERVRCK